MRELHVDFDFKTSGCQRNRKLCGGLRGYKLASRAVMLDFVVVEIDAAHPKEEAATQAGGVLDSTAS